MDGKEAEVSGLSGRAHKAVEEVIKDVLKRAIQEIVEEKNEVGIPIAWLSLVVV